MWLTSAKLFLYTEQHREYNVGVEVMSNGWPPGYEGGGGGGQRESMWWW